MTDSPGRSPHALSLSPSPGRVAVARSSPSRGQPPMSMSGHRQMSARSFSGGGGGGANIQQMNSQSVNSTTGRARAAFIRSNNEVGPMSQEQRMKLQAKNVIRKIFLRQNNSNHNSNTNNNEPIGDSGSVGDLSNFDRRSFHSGRSHNSNRAGQFLRGLGLSGDKGDSRDSDGGSELVPPGFISPVHNDIHNNNNNNGGAAGPGGTAGGLDYNMPPPNPQYRLEATTVQNQHTGGGWNCGRTLLPCLCGSRVGGVTTGIGIHHNKRLASSLHWMFRVNFLFLFGVMCAIFFMWVMIFAGFIVAAGKMDPQCVRAGGQPFNELQSQFADSFALSWTTFSTVGYGSTYPALGHENDNPTNCLFITFICSLESFLGVLYSGFCGAILFGKVLRIQSHAQVIFSDPIVIRYGSGMHGDSDTVSNDEETGAKQIPCPVLEFRVINRLYGETGGEIMDATLTVVANIDADDADPGLEDELEIGRGRHSHNHSHMRRQSSTVPSLGGSFLRSRADSRADSRGGGRRRGSDDNSSNDLNNGSHPDSEVNDSMSDTHSDSGRTSLDSKATGATRNTFFFDSLLRRQQHHAVDEDPTARLVNKRIFSKLMIEAPEHPFFKRVWLGRHTLDETSPILKPRVRRQIRRNGGYWPERLNNYKAVRESLQFNQILVSLNGVSNVSASDVYAQKIYDFVDINVGYQFVNVLYKDESNDTLKVDTELINDVRIQKGGGGEPLILGE
mmetsp:Transcript_14503/g.35164  ORF Transcript_14503/g.35164 Transcript_14503/m.35164 type:complete len:730 (+) Transcript_14503:96-2285(+)